MFTVLNSLGLLVGILWSSVLGSIVAFMGTLTHSLTWDESLSFPAYS